MAYEIFWEEGGVRCVYTEELTDTQLMEVDMAIREHPEFAGFRYGIADFSRVKNFNINSEGVQNTARLDSNVSEDNPAFRFAIISPSKLMRGYARMWELTGGSDVWDTKIFDDM